MVMQPVWRVKAWNATHRKFTVRSVHTDPDDANEHAEALWWKGNKRVYVEPGSRPVLTVTAPVAASATREFRLDQAARMSDRKDACKPYKSNGSDQLALHR